MKTNTEGKRRITLFFTAGSALTARDLAALNSIPGGAHHRNASLIGEEDKPEPCDAVAGEHIPEQYADKEEVEIDWEAVDARLAEGDSDDAEDAAPAAKRKARKRKAPAAE